MRVVLIFLSVALFANSAGADERVRVTSGEMLGILNEDEILLRNRSGQQLVFYLSLEGGTWTKFNIRERGTALIQAVEMVVAIATTPVLLGEDPEPALAPVALVDGARLTEGAFYYAQFDGAARVELCWSGTDERWVAQPTDGKLCR